MEAKDLRIGNYIYDDIKERVVQLTGISDSHDEVWVDYYNGKGIYLRDLHYIKSIQLTEQWLLDFGFGKGADNNYNFLPIPQETMLEAYLFCNFVESEKNFNSGIAFVDCFDDKVEISMQMDFKHVHQLQNLYFALTNKELIKK